MKVVKKYKFLVKKGTGVVMYMMTIFKTVVRYIWKLLDPKSSHHNEKKFKKSIVVSV